MCVCICVCVYVCVWLFNFSVCIIVSATYCSCFWVSSFKCLLGSMWFDIYHIFSIFYRGLTKTCIFETENVWANNLTMHHIFLLVFVLNFIYFLGSTTFIQIQANKQIYKRVEFVIWIILILTTFNYVPFQYWIQY